MLSVADLQRLAPGCMGIDPNALDQMRANFSASLQTGRHSQLFLATPGSDVLANMASRLEVPLMGTSEYPMESAVRSFFLPRAQDWLPNAERAAAARVLEEYLAEPQPSMSVPRWQLARRQLERMARG